MLERETYKKNIYEIVSGTKWNSSELIGNISCAISMADLLDMDVYIWGNGTYCYSYCKFFLNEGLRICNIIDSDKNKEGMERWGIKCISPETLKEKEHKKDAFVFVCIPNYIASAQELIIKDILDAGVTHFYCLSEQDSNEIIEEYEYNIGDLRGDYYLENIQKIYSFIDMLDDEESLLTLQEFIRTYCENNVYKGNTIPSKYKYFYDNNKAEIYKHLDEEVWLNCGANVGDTIYSYFRQGLLAKRIYAVESDLTVFGNLKTNLEKLPMQYLDTIKMYQTYVDDSLDVKKLFGQKISLINADIEGEELNMLKALKDIIQNDRPVIAICLYHRKDDIVLIPEFFKKTVDDYSFFLRKYSSWYRNIHRNHEIVLYAVPNERCVAERK